MTFDEALEVKKQHLGGEVVIGDFAFQVTVIPLDTNDYGRYVEHFRVSGNYPSDIDAKMFSQNGQFKLRGLLFVQNSLLDCDPDLA
jgi:hypothetical protein